MASAHAHGRSSSSPSTVSGHTNTLRPHQYDSPILPEQPSSRQQRLTESRSARFVGKKLSLNDLSTRFSRLIHANEEPRLEETAQRNQENTPTKQKALRSLGKRKSSTRSLGILDEISNTIIPRSPRKRGSIPVYFDDSEKSIPEDLPVSPPAVYDNKSGEKPSPIGFDNFQDSLNRMHLREASGNEQRGSPLASSPLTGSIKAVRKRRSMPFKPAFDTQDYISHIEQELQQARKELQSPLSKRTLNEQLKTSKNENDRLKVEIASLRETFETEVKHTVEHMMAVEADLKMKVRDLEEELEKKDFIIQDLEYRHEDKRLDCNTVETLKAAIERLEQEKASMEDENRSMSKRNEVLSELLAMSPTKLQSHFELKSPVREKRAGRPMSMILPRLPSSPTFKPKTYSASTAVSPSMSVPDYFQLPVSQLAYMPSISQDGWPSQRRPSDSYRASSRQSREDDTVSLLSGTGSQTLPPSPTNESMPRPLPKRKPRRFMAGSTQLKPLLLPTLKAEPSGHPAASAITSPRSLASRDFSQESFDPTTYFLSRPSDCEIEDLKLMDILPRQDVISNERQYNAPTHYETFDKILAEHEASAGISPSGRHETRLDVPSSPSFVTLTNTDNYISHETQTIPEELPEMSLNAPRNDVELGSHSSPRFDTWVRESAGRREASSTLPDQLDLEALDRLELHGTYFSPLPQQVSDSDDCLLIDVPQPLFSPVSRTLPCNRTLQQLESTSLTDSPIKLVPRKRRQSASLIEESICLPTPKNLSFHMLPRTSSSQRSLLLSSGASTSASEKSQSTERRSSCSSRSLTRNRSPLELLQQRNFGARPLASLTIRTIYGTISRCTAYIREFRRDPFALARKVIANAWLSNWARFGKLSWWVLGLFLSPVKDRSNAGWQWDQYDAEGIAQAVCDEQAVVVTRSGENHSEAPTGQAPESQKTNDANSSATRKPGWGKSLLLWGKFSIAIMLAVGGAVVHGPGEMLQSRDHMIPQSVHEGKGRGSCSDGTKRNKSHYPKQSGSPTKKHEQQKRLDQHQATTGQPEPWTNNIAKQGRHSPAFTFRSQQQLGARSASDASDRANHDTLRPAKTPRTHAANFFRTEGFTSHEYDPVSMDRSDHEEITHSRACSVDGGTLQWPPSLDIACSDSASSGSRQHSRGRSVTS